MQKGNVLLLVIMVPEEMKDRLVDALMAQTQLSGFSLSKIQGFSQNNSHFNVKEQVEGYKDLFRFEVMHEASLSEQLLLTINGLFQERRLRYWLTPVLASSE
jgi:hypothetical protein